MSFRRMILKDIAGNARAVATLGTKPTKLTLPQNVTVLACLTDRVFFPPKADSVPLDEGTASLSVLCRAGEDLLFGSTLPPKDAAFAKWRLRTALEQGTPREVSPKSEPPAPPLIEEEAEAANAPLDTSPNEKEQNVALEGEPPISEAPEMGKRQRAEALMKRGTPFPLFEKMMPNSRWAIIRDDSAEYLVGIKDEEDGEHILFGIAGTRSLPPDEGRLWTFFPTEDEEIGYYLTEEEEM